MTLTQELIEELRLLHRGRGVAAAELGSRLGPRLLSLTELGSDADTSRLRAELMERLRLCVARLGDAELRLAAEADLGLRHSHLELAERRARLVIDLRWSERTVYRRVDEARCLLAEVIATELSGRGDSAEGWYLASFDALMRLDRDPVSIHESRTIVSTRDGLDEVELPFDVPQGAGGGWPRLDFDARSGGEIVAADASSPRRPRTRVALSKTLARGQTHLLEIDITVAEGELPRPHYILIPERTVERARLRVRFDKAALPRWVRRVEAEPVRAFDPPHDDGQWLVPDRSGEVGVEFRRLCLQLGYGIQWGTSIA
ncbi:hypothetical protein [Stackebrandtia nassauensis]|uniref:Uncharacterized protein n=1 Tax=Stackebrandtia nassauensis (strain DSM 44728 / CIP 108903 / NRRL B-16338 / NBRC 102104 / LLR-40K-21) TaxID=446470 RepID=D3Q295_STANL|nr:hypothetical protein [Stackebrandtia nassauensis]ADD43828.1 hypothetical protein Snas_4178 [Stackebrandtia nassauensis DSM 44728]